MKLDRTAEALFHKILKEIYITRDNKIMFRQYLDTTEEEFAYIKYYKETGRFKHESLK